MVKPADFASATDRGFVISGTLTLLITLRTGFLHTKHTSKGARSIGRRSSNPLRHTVHDSFGSSGLVVMYS